MAQDEDDDPLRRQARLAKAEFFNESVAARICAGLVTSFLPLSSDDLQLWDTDPEEYGKLL